MIQRLRSILKRPAAAAAPKTDGFNDVALEAYYRLAPIGAASSVVAAEAVAAEMGADPEDVMAALQELAEASCIEVRVLRGGGRVLDVTVLDVRPDGLRRLGVWPE